MSTQVNAAQSGKQRGRKPSVQEGERNGCVEIVAILRGRKGCPAQAQCICLRCGGTFDTRTRYFYSHPWCCDRNDLRGHDAEFVRLSKNARRRFARKNDSTYAERRRAYNRTWITKRTPARRAALLSNQLRRRSGIGHFTKHDQNLILNFQGGRCTICGPAENLHLDHALPLSRGGTHWPVNLRYLCSRHNLEKGTMTDAEYRNHTGILIPAPPLLTLFRAAFAMIVA